MGNRRLTQERDQARQDVLRLRDGLGELWEALTLFRSDKGNHPALEATDHYEQYRQEASDGTDKPGSADS